MISLITTFKITQFGFLCTFPSCVDSWLCLPFCFFGFFFSSTFLSFFSESSFSLLALSTTSFPHHVSFLFGLPHRVQPQAVSLALSRQVLISFQALSVLRGFWKDFALSWTQFPNSKRTSGSDNFYNFRFGGMQHDLLNVVFNSRSPTSSLCCETHSSLPKVLTSRTDLK